MIITILLSVTVISGAQNRHEAAEDSSQTIVKNKNDHPPLFDRANYDIAVVERTRNHTRIFRLIASDEDEGENGRITYNLHSPRFPQDIHYFGWDNKTGDVWLNKKLDRHVGSLFVLKATALDGGTPPKSSDIDVTIEVKASSRKPPVFFNGSGTNIKLSEGTVDFSKPIASYSAHSGIPGDPTVSFELFTRKAFELTNRKAEQTNKTATFRATQDKDNQQQVNIYVIKPLEFKGVKWYTLALQVRNIDDLVSEVQLNVKVTDKNNQALIKSPVFLNGPGTNIEISEGSVDVTKPIASYIADSQIHGEPTVFFELINGKDEWTNKAATFRATKDKDNHQKVNIYVAKHLEFEAIPWYNLTLQVTNVADLVSEAQLTVKIKDENNHAPRFANLESGEVYCRQKKNGSFKNCPIHKVFENEAPGTVVMQVSTIDLDGTYPNNKVTYSLSNKDQSILDKFHIDPDTGVLTTKVKFNREEKAVYAVTVIAQDGGESWYLKNGEPNTTPQTFRIDIAEKNNNVKVLQKEIEEEGSTDLSDDEESDDDDLDNPPVEDRRRFNH